ncbi:16S rRNA (guanine(527)-N(7))-methyltransferase RsmG [Campylobacter sp. 2018MI35]|uniref:16S rRNA (guanine(527)-N(7))-methyltransferase RsmG n=1 Tax=unclassified Campylobacter TaxID=2593542 RepID=UPI0019063C31|nr:MULTISPECIES: 16S rRNA (guanine(527)-N(7))-methyltransferase RsmG [unclassified Campylobacter]MBK1971087.1 16S rRNA (guanine(527)-N(7))-methyltransferase RsmG [Campylobacter sp. TTU_617]MBK1992153.1 16S rRNA (guanine(527)-N(7))-methyltransferase RsmG [Campylobacter sp. 2018MI34]
MHLYLENLDFLKEYDIKNFENKIQIYKNLLNKYNRIHNLTQFKTIDENIIDSLKILDFKDLNFAKNIIDIGSGAGFPAIFLAFVLKSQFYLFEPNAKKAAFLRNVKIECKLDNVFIVKEKIQDYKSQLTADIITSRAFSDISSLIKLCRNFYNEHTLFLLYKGSKVYEECKILKEYEIIERDFRKYCLFKGILPQNSFKS